MINIDKEWVSSVLSIIHYRMLFLPEQNIIWSRERELQKKVRYKIINPP